MFHAAADSRPTPITTVNFNNFVVGKRTANAMTSMDFFHGRRFISSRIVTAAHRTQKFLIVVFDEIAMLAHTAEAAIHRSRTFTMRLPLVIE